MTCLHSRKKCSINLNISAFLTPNHAPFRTINLWLLLDSVKSDCRAVLTDTMRHLEFFFLTCGVVDSFTILAATKYVNI